MKTNALLIPIIALTMAASAGYTQAASDAGNNRPVAHESKLAAAGSSVASHTSKAIDSVGDVAKSGFHAASSAIDTVGTGIRHAVSGIHHDNSQSSHPSERPSRAN